jgi:site-specific DNA recombinase
MTTGRTPDERDPLTAKSRSRRAQRVTAAYLYNLLRLPWLAPDVTTAIVNGRQPQQLTAKALMRMASRLPADWVAQRTMLGFQKP